jgi:hypothetical protein
LYKEILTANQGKETSEKFQKSTEITFIFLPLLSVILIEGTKKEKRA